MNWIILRLPAHVFNDCKECILNACTICVQSNHTCKLISFYIANIETTTSLAAATSRAVCLLHLIAPHCTEYSKYQSDGRLRSLKIGHTIFVLQVKIRSIFSLEILNIHLLISRRNIDAAEKRSSLPALLFSCPLGRYMKDQLIEFNYFSNLNYFLGRPGPYLYSASRSSKTKKIQNCFRGGWHLIKDERHSSLLPNCFNPKIKNRLFIMPNRVASSTTNNHLEALEWVNTNSRRRLPHNMVWADIETTRASTKATTVMFCCGFKRNTVLQSALVLGCSVTCVQTTKSLQRWIQMEMFYRFCQLSFYA